MRSKGGVSVVEMKDTVSFGYWVQQRRLALGFTRPALAQRVHCSPDTIKKIERDERRPSLQLAELLAEHLLIPESERRRFVGMARGEFVATPLSAPDLVSLPAFLLPSARNRAEKPAPLVARECEMERLAAHLESARAGNGGIVFIVGEAGDGKTMLAQAFVRQSQEVFSDLVAATGNCNAYTGIGDPYLPFREILELLTGDIESHWDASVQARTYAERLWRLVPHTVQALLDAGPDLVDTFLPGAPLLARATAAAPVGDPRLLDRLQRLVDRKEAEPQSTNLHQSNLFAQYLRVLQTLARRQPLLLVIDDLQWADVGSISLLFHLSRHLQGHPILFVGIYRGAEVALGRDGQRHPLEPLINELQRTFGEIHVRLNQAEGRRFVDALIDRESNRLDRAFRDALYRQTAGHPLFTVEMLHGLQERGDLVPNADGEWVESPQLDWGLLPARVEGVIKERIGRLPRPLQELLQMASVAGETFCLEVIAHVYGADARQVSRQLTSVISPGQGLVRVQGTQRVGAQQLSLYGFRHIVFQQYLYNTLDTIRRADLHRAIAEELEQRYDGETQLIARQLARHYSIAGNDARALHYYTVAGDAAAAVYANAEAEAHYRRALELAGAPSTDAEQAGLSRQLLHLYLRLGRALELSSRQDRAIVAYEEMERVAQERDDPAMALASLLARAALRTTVNFARNPVEGRALLERARAIALDMDDRAAEARILWNLLILNAYTGGDARERLVHGEEALALARELDLPEQLAFTLHDSFYAYAGTGQWEKARAAVCEARALWKKLDNLPMFSASLMRLHWATLVTGDYEDATAFAEEAFRLGVESHNAEAQALSHFMLGFVHWERGQIEQALAVMTEDIALAETINSLTPLVGTRADLGLLYGELGDVERGLALAEQARRVAEEHLPILRFWPHAVQVLLHLQKDDLPAAQEFAATLADYATVKERFGYMPFMWVRVGLAHGEIALQQQAFDQAAGLMDSLYTDLIDAGIWYLRPDVLHLKGRALLGCGHLDHVRDVLLEARAAAEKLGSLRALWPVQVSLAAVAAHRGDSAGADVLRRQAADIAEEIARGIGSESLVRRFMQLPLLQDLYRFLSVR